MMLFDQTVHPNTRSTSLGTLLQNPRAPLPTSLPLPLTTVSLHGKGFNPGFSVVKVVAGVLVVADAVIVSGKSLELGLDGWRGIGVDVEPPAAPTPEPTPAMFIMTLFEFESAPPGPPGNTPALLTSTPEVMTAPSSAPPPPPSSLRRCRSSRKCLKDS